MSFDRWMGLSAAAVVCVSGMASTAPTDAEVNSKIQAFSSWASKAGPEDKAEYQKRLTELVNAWDPSDLTTKQIGKLGQYYISEGSKLIDAYNVVDGRSDGDSAEATGAMVVAAWLWMYQQRTPPSPEELRDLLELPKLDEALAQGVGGQIYAMAAIFASNTPPQAVHPMLGDLIGLSKKLEKTEGYEAALGAVDLYTAVSPLIDDKAEEAAFRTRVSDALARAKGELGEGMDHVAEAIDGANKKLNFIGGQAPEIAFTWTSDGLDAKSLSDLKGNVVVLDFWATWCGPCIAAFPKVHDLVEHYEGYPVKIIGVTSLQGTHVNPDNTPVDTEGDPDKEYSLMPGFIDARDMTWNVAFSEQNVFNPDYSVHSIPHLAFIAPDGTVRFNGLNPHMLSEEEEHAIIDGMLKEFNLPTPSEG